MFSSNSFMVIALLGGLLVYFDLKIVYGVK